MSILDPLPAKSVDKELWRPTWKCYCCNDTGLIPAPHYLDELVGEDYPYAVRCNATGCREGWAFDVGVDTRAPIDWCDSVDKRRRDEWRKWLSKRQQRQREAMAVIKKFTDSF